MSSQDPVVRPVLPSSSSTLAEFDDFKKSMALMMSVTQEMKEIPELPSEQPKDTTGIVNVEISDAVGVLTWMRSHPYPYHGFPYFEFVDKIDMLKKVIRNVLSGIYHQLKNRNKLLFLTFLSSFWMTKVAMRAGIYTFYRIIERFRVKPTRYSPAMQTLYRAFSVERDREQTKTKELRWMLRDVLCMVMEFDNAYRFRFQEFIVELNKEHLQRKPIAEIVRLFELLSKWENLQEQKDKWRLVKYLLRYYLRYDRELRNILRDGLLSLELEKVKLMPEDKYFCIKREDIKMPFIQEASGPIETLTKEQKADRLIIERVKLRDKQMASVEELNQFMVKERGKLTQKHEAELKMLDGLIEQHTKELEQLTKAQEEERKPIVETIKQRHEAELNALGKTFEPFIAAYEEKYQKETNDLTVKFS